MQVIDVVVRVTFYNIITLVGAKLRLISFVNLFLLTTGQVKYAKIQETGINIVELLSSDT